MAGFDLFGSTQRLLTASLHVHSARHSILTANVANADTPGYRPRDIDFARMLQTVVQPEEGSVGNQGGVTLVSTHPLHHQQHGFPLSESDSESTEGEEALDRNQVDLDGEITRLVENTLQHETSLTLLSRTLGSLRYAISEGRR
jgi:flagellar basal-body rod protein FlgB